MSRPLAILEPACLWRQFEMICSIPHPSYQEDALMEAIKALARAHHLPYKEDAAGNLLITKEGSRSGASIVLQAHVDMVAQKTEDNPHDFGRDPICPVIEGAHVRAKGTTLGADNGIGLASILAVLVSCDLVHPKIEALITRTEEVGMEGALALGAGFFESKRLLNTDAETIDELYIGCAGGVDANASARFDVYPALGCALHVRLSGGLGGHSGIDIDKARGNAICALASCLCALDAPRLVSFEGGSVRNAIPREAAGCVLVTDANAASRALHAAHKAHPNPFDLEISQGDAKNALDAKDSARILEFLSKAPNGVLQMSCDLADTVAASSSLGVASLVGGVFEASFLIRALDETCKHQAQKALQAVGDECGIALGFDADYPGWCERPDSPWVKTVAKAYQAVSGAPITLKTIHAGLECGIIKQSAPDLLAVSIGPTITGAHSPDEAVDIASVARYWQVLTRILAQA